MMNQSASGFSAWWMWAFLPALCLVAGLAPGAPPDRPTTSSSVDLVASGASLLNARQYVPALASFLAAIERDPSDPEAWLFAGVAFNRIARWEEADHHLTHARELGDSNPALDFEAGWALVELGRPGEAARCLERYVEAHPGRAQASDFLGRAYLGLERYDDAEGAFKRALDLDPDLKPAIDVYLAVLRRQREAMSLTLGPGRRRLDLSRQVPLANPDTVAGRLEREQGTGTFTVPGMSGTQAAATGATRPWWLQASVGAGYNSDAQGATGQLDAQSPKPRGGSGFERFSLDAGYVLVSTPADKLSLGYEVLDDTFFRHALHADLLDQYVYGEWEHVVGDALGRPLSAAVRASEDFTLIGDSRFRNQAGARAALDWQLGPGLTAEAAYSYDQNNYLFPVRPDAFGGTALRRDANTHSLTVSAVVRLPGTAVDLRGGYFHVWNFADGGDFDYRGDGLYVGVTSPLFWDISVDVFYTHELDRYRHPNTAAATENTRRRDQTDGLNIQLTRPLSDHLIAYLTFDYDTDRSNIAFYGYTQNVVSSGLIWKF